MPHDRDDSGFSLVEVMVALAITAAMSMGIGGLVAFGTQVQDRAAAASETEERLVALMALSASIERLAAMNLSEGDEDSFTLARDDRPNGLRIALAGDILTATVETFTESPQSESGASRVALDSFDSVALEYLHRDNQGGPSWDTLARPAVLGARLVVTRRPRTWPIILWLRPRSSIP